MSMTFSLALFFLFYPKATGLYRSALLLFCLIFPLMISSSRLYLGVHYLNDVLGGIWLGFFWAVLMVWRFEISQATKP